MSPSPVREPGGLVTRAARGAAGAAGKVLGLPFKGLGLAARALWAPAARRHPWLKVALIGLPILVLLALVSPLAGILTRLLDGLGALLRPILESPAGRFLLANTCLVLLLWILWRLVRNRLRRLLGAYVLGRYLEGLSQLLKGEDLLALRRFRAALWWATWVDLSEAVPELPGLKGDACVRLAMVALRQGRVNEALRFLLRVRDQDLSPESRASHRELLARAYAAHHSLGREAVDTKLASLLAEEPRNARLLGLVRQRREEARDWAEAAAAQERLLAQLRGPALEEGRKRLALLRLEEAKQARGSGLRDQATRLARMALKEWPDMEEARILLGDLAQELGQPDRAVRLWSAAPGLLALERLEGLAGAGSEARAIAPRDLARSFPYAGVLVILARRWMEEGEFRRARNALRKLLELGNRSPRVLTLYASVLERMGEHEAAARACREALGVLLKLPGGSSETPPEAGQE